MYWLGRWDERGDKQIRVERAKDAWKVRADVRSWSVGASGEEEVVDDSSGQVTVEEGKRARRRTRQGAGSGCLVMGRPFTESYSENIPRKKESLLIWAR